MTAITSQQRATTGLRATFTSGKLGKGTAYIKRISDRMRVVLEEAVIQRYGACTTYEHALIQSAGRHEVRAQLCQRKLRQLGDSLESFDRWMSLTKEIGHATDARDRCIMRLGIEHLNSKSKIVDALYGSPVDAQTHATPQVDSEVDPTCDNALGATLGAFSVMPDGESASNEGGSS